MSEVERFCFPLILGLALGMFVSAWAQDRLDNRAVNSGYFVHKDRAYQLVPAPTPSNPNRSE